MQKGCYSGPKLSAAAKNRALQLVSTVAAVATGHGDASPHSNSVASSIGVRAQLHRILESEWFAQSRRMRRFLEFVIEETLAGRSDQLCEYTIALAVFDQRDSFEPALNPIVRNDARRLRQKLHEYYRHMDTDVDRVLIDVPKGGYVPVFSPILLKANATAQDTAPRLKLRIAAVRDGAQIWVTECECRAGETVEVQINLVSGARP